MRKEIHFYPYGFEGASTDWAGTENAIAEMKNRIDTTQMGLLSADLWLLGYRIFLHDEDGSAYELKPGEDARSGKELRPAHNLFNMWQAGRFSCS